MPVDPPHRACHRSVAGRCSGTLDLAVTDWPAVRASRISLADWRTRLETDAPVVVDDGGAAAIPFPWLDTEMRQDAERIPDGEWVTRTRTTAFTWRAAPAARQNLRRPCRSGARSCDGAIEDRRGAYRRPERSSG
jgi:hypothetical protein